MNPEVSIASTDAKGVCKGPRSRAPPQPVSGKPGNPPTQPREGGGAYAEGGRAAGRSQNGQSAVVGRETERHRSPPGSGDEPDAKNAKKVVKGKDGVCGLDAIVAVALKGDSPGPEEMRSSSGSASGSEGSSGNQGRGGQRNSRKKHEERDSPTPESGRDSGQGSGNDENFVPEGQSAQGNKTEKEAGALPHAEAHPNNNGSSENGDTETPSNNVGGDGRSGVDQGSANDTQATGGTRKSSAHGNGTGGASNGHGKHPGSEEGTPSQSTGEEDGRAGQGSSSPQGDTAHHAGVTALLGAAAHHLPGSHNGNGGNNGNNGGSGTCTDYEEQSQPSGGSTDRDTDRDGSTEGGENSGGGSKGGSEGTSAGASPAGGSHDGSRPKLPRPEGPVHCPRCKSDDTKFCYYNNYNVKQPRHFCKACQRYWTAGGMLRNVPVGAGRRKNKAQSSAQSQVKVGMLLPETMVLPYGQAPGSLHGMGSTLAMHAARQGGKHEPRPATSATRSLAMDQSYVWSSHHQSTHAMHQEPHTMALSGHSGAQPWERCGDTAGNGGTGSSGASVDLLHAAHQAFPAGVGSPFAGDAAAMADKLVQQKRLLAKSDRTDPMSVVNTLGSSAYASTMWQNAEAADLHGEGTGGHAVELNGRLYSTQRHEWHESSTMNSSGMLTDVSASAGWGGNSSSAAHSHSAAAQAVAHVVQQQGQAWNPASPGGASANAATWPYSAYNGAVAATASPNPEYANGLNMASAAHAQVISYMTQLKQHQHQQQSSLSVHDAKIFASGWNAANAAATGPAPAARPGATTTTVAPSWNSMHMANLYNHWPSNGSSAAAAATAPPGSVGVAEGLGSQYIPPMPVASSGPTSTTHNLMAHTHPALMANPPAMWRNLQFQQAQAQEAVVNAVHNVQQAHAAIHHSWTGAARRMPSGGHHARNGEAQPLHASQTR